MSTADLQTLWRHLNRLNEYEFEDYRAVHVLELARMEVPSMFFTRETLRIIVARFPEEERLRFLTRSYCWLTPRNKLPSWRLYLLNSGTDLTMHCPTLFERIKDAMSVPDLFVEMAWRIVGDGFYACLVSEDEEILRSGEHKVVSIAVWGGLPFLAVRLEGATIERSFRFALRGALVGESITPLDVIHEDLVTALVAGRTIVNLLADP